MSNGGDNRRRFFRIVDALGVSYQVIPQQQMDLQSADGDSEAKTPFVDTLSVMNNFNDVIQQSLEKIQVNDPETATAIEQLNKKVDALMMMLELDNLITQHACHRVEEASISASGVAFPVEELLEPNTSLALDLLLRPSAKHVNAIGRVISCDHLAEDSQYYLRVEFTEMEDKDKEVLIQHIVQRQGVLLRALKEEMDE